MTVCPRGDELRSAVAGTLDADRQEQLEQHLEHCAACQHFLVSMTDEDRVIPTPQRWPESSQGSAPLHQVIERLSNGARSSAMSSDAATEIGMPSNWVQERLPFLQPAQLPGFLGKLGPYEIRRLIGRGGMGMVFEALDPVLKRPVAIKVLSPLTAWNDNARNRFLREAQAAAALSHEHLVAIHGVHLEAEVPFLVLQYVEGESLAGRLRRLGRLPFAEVVRIGLEAARGLAAAHARGLVHRDIKPANILLEHETGRVKIADFGLAKNLSDATLTLEGTVAGTPEFMSPEQAAGLEVDARSDLFSLGVVLYLAATGVSPFAAPAPHLVLERVRQANPRPIEEVDPSLPAWFCGIVARLLAREPRDRIESAAALARLLERSETPARVPRRFPKRMAAVVSGSALVLIGAVLAFWNWPNRIQPRPPGRDLPPETGFKIAGRTAVFPSLGDALAAAQDNDVIEVHGNGPFPNPPMRTEGKRLTIRAVPPANPVFVSDVPNRVSTAPWITTDADLRLEGITIYWTTEAPAPAKTETSMLASAAIASTRGELSLAHCRVVAADRSGCISAACPNLSLSQCHLVCDKGAAVFWRPSPGGRVTMAGCVLEGNTGLTLLTATDARAPTPAVLGLTHNTFAVEKSFQLVVQAGPRHTLQFTARQNIFAGAQIVNLYATRIPRDLLPDTPEKTIGHLRSITRWSEEGNVYRRGLFLGVDSVLVPRTVQRTEFASLADWLKIWNLPANASTEGDIRFHPRERPETEPPRLERVENPSGPVPERVGADPARVGPPAATPGR